ncbi:hypothetical protein C8J56DRAFT_986354 [Mycena floridula]|nr:hypothetical protein C8J56DRAFT_986354 [Mycena floridula]
MPNTGLDAKFSSALQRILILTEGLVVANQDLATALRDILSQEAPSESSLPEFSAPLSSSLSSLSSVTSQSPSLRHKREVTITEASSPGAYTTKGESRMLLKDFIPPANPSRHGSSPEAMLSLSSKLASISMAPKSPPKPHPCRDSPIPSSIPWRWTYGVEIPTPADIDIVVQGLPEGPLYVVTVGISVGVFSNWSLASPYVIGVSGNSYRAVASRAAAVRYWTEAYEMDGPRPAIRIVS